MPVIACCSQKGGVGKTTTVLNLAAALAAREERVAVVDLDPQAALTASVLGEEATHGRPPLYSALLAGQALREPPRLTDEGFSLVRGGADLAGIEIELLGLPDRFLRLRKAIASLRRQGTILIDCPPSLGVLVVNALAASDFVLVPVAAEYLALRGLATLLEALDRVRDTLAPELSLLGILPTMVEARTLHAREILAALRERFGSAVFSAEVPRSVRFREAPIARQSILRYAPESEGAQAYRLLAEEVVARVAASRRAGR